MNDTPPMIRTIEPVVSFRVPVGIAPFHGAGSALQSMSILHNAGSSPSALGLFSMGRPRRMSKVF
jgi:hypothetical protein